MVVLSITLFGLFFFSKEINNKETAEIQVGENSMVVWIAQTTKERKSGLSGTESLGDVDGMLFLFPREERYRFWMRDMSFPIDIIYFNAEKEVVEIMSEISPQTYPLKFTAQKPVKYVLEVKGGAVKEKGIMIGEKLTLPNNYYE